jgi:predicted transcriptional regulator
MRTMERLNITVDDEQYERLARMADRMHLQPGTLARSLLLTALDEVTLDADNVVRLLDGLPDAYERVELGRRQAEAGETVSLEDLA